jgi:hypothetical protein
MRIIIALLALSLASITYTQNQISDVELTSQTDPVSDAIKKQATYKNIAELVSSETATTEALRTSVEYGRNDIARLLLNNQAIPDQNVVLECAERSRSSKKKNEWWILYLWTQSARKNAQQGFFGRILSTLMQ